MVTIQDGVKAQVYKEDIDMANTPRPNPLLGALAMGATATETAKQKNLMEQKMKSEIMTAGLSAIGEASMRASLVPFNVAQARRMEGIQRLEEEQREINIPALQAKAEKSVELDNLTTDISRRFRESGGVWAESDAKLFEKLLSRDTNIRKRELIDYDRQNRIQETEMDAGKQADLTEIEENKNKLARMVADTEMFNNPEKFSIKDPNTSSGFVEDGHGEVIFTDNKGWYQFTQSRKDVDLLMKNEAILDQIWARTDAERQRTQLIDDTWSDQVERIGITNSLNQAQVDRLNQEHSLAFSRNKVFKKVNDLVSRAYDKDGELVNGGERMLRAAHDMMLKDPNQFKEPTARDEADKHLMTLMNPEGKTAEEIATAKEGLRVFKDTQNQALQNMSFYAQFLDPDYEAPSQQLFHLHEAVQGLTPEQRLQFVTTGRIVTEQGLSATDHYHNASSTTSESIIGNNGQPVKVRGALYGSSSPSLEKNHLLVTKEDLKNKIQGSPEDMVAEIDALEFTSLETFLGQLQDEKVATPGWMRIIRRDQDYGRLPKAEGDRRDRGTWSSYENGMGSALAARGLRKAIMGNKLGEAQKVMLRPGLKSSDWRGIVASNVIESIIKEPGLNDGRLYNITDDEFIRGITVDSIIHVAKGFGSSPADSKKIAMDAVKAARGIESDMKNVLLKDLEVSGFTGRKDPLVEAQVSYFQAHGDWDNLKDKENEKRKAIELQHAQGEEAKRKTIDSAGLGDAISDAIDTAKFMERYESTGKPTEDTRENPGLESLSPTLVHYLKSKDNVLEHEKNVSKIIRSLKSQGVDEQSIALYIDTIKSKGVPESIETYLDYLTGQGVYE